MVGFFCFAQLRVILAHLRVDLVPFRVASAHRRVIPRLFTASLFRVAALVRRFGVAAVGGVSCHFSLVTPQGVVLKSARQRRSL